MPCKNINYKGHYGFTVTGFVTDHTVTPPGPLEPIAVVGIYEADGKGNIKGSQTRSFKGAIFNETYTETYTVNSDCTGTSVKTVTKPKIVTNWSFVILHRGKTILSIEADKDRVLTFRAERM
jgi:hypothetical protein